MAIETPTTGIWVQQNDSLANGYRATPSSSAAPPYLRRQQRSLKTRG